jgi:hypothetical protein
MELLQMISGLTKDDTAVLSVFKAIFDSHKVRLAHSMVPIQLVTGQKAHRIY